MVNAWLKRSRSYSEPYVDIGFLLAKVLSWKEIRSAEEKPVS